MRKINLDHITKLVDYLSQFSYIEVSSMLNYFLQKDESKIITEKEVIENESFETETGQIIKQNKYFLCDDKILNLCIIYLSEKKYKDVYHLISYIYSSEEILDEIRLQNEE